MAPQQTCQESAAHQNSRTRQGGHLIREATMRPKITLKELQSSTAEIGVSVHVYLYGRGLTFFFCHLSFRVNGMSSSYVWLHTDQ